MNAFFSSSDRRYLHLAMPAAMEGLFMVLLSSVDIIMVGCLGIAAVAAVSIFTQPRMMILCVTRSAAAALTLMTARHYGAREYDKALRLTGQTVTVSFFVLGLLHLFFFWKLEAILSWMGAEESYMELALEYGYPALAGVALTSAATILQALQLGYGQTGVVLSSNLQGNVVNVLGNACFIFGLGPFPEMGVAGAAIGTVLGTAWSLAVTMWAMAQRRMLPREFLPDPAYFRAFLPVFGGVFSEQGFERLGMVLYTRMVAELGALPYAVHAICMNFCDIYYCFAGGLGKASMVAAGHAKGAGDPGGWRASLKSGIKWSFAFSVISCALTLLFREEIFTIYSDEAAALPLGVLIMAYVAWVSFPEAHAMVCAGALRGSGHTTEVAVYSFVSVAILRPVITAVFLYQLGLGLAGAWLALAIDQSLRAACSSLLLGRAWKKICLGT